MSGAGLAEDGRKKISGLFLALCDTTGLIRLFSHLANIAQDSPAPGGLAAEGIGAMGQRPCAVREESDAPGGARCSITRC